MNGEGRPAILSKILCNVVGNALGADEDQDLRVFLADLIQVLDQFVPLFEITANFNDLTNVVVRSEFHRSNIDLNEIFQKILGAHHLIWEGYVMKRMDD